MAGSEREAAARGPSALTCSASHAAHRAPGFSVRPHTRRPVRTGQGTGERTRSNPSPAEAKVVFTLHFSVYDPTAFVLLEMSESFQKALKTVLVLREVNTEAEVPGPPAPHRAVLFPFVEVLHLP